MSTSCSLPPSASSWRISVPIDSIFSHPHPLHASITVPIHLEAIYIISFLLMSTFIALQIQINFEFLALDKSYTIIRKSCQVPLFLFRYYMACELAVTLTSGTIMMLILAVMTVAILGFILWMDEVRD
jgi:hypothetical protein